MVQILQEHHSSCFSVLTAGPTEAPSIVAAAVFADAMHHVSQRKEIHHLSYGY